MQGRRADAARGSPGTRRFTAWITIGWLAVAGAACDSAKERPPGTAAPSRADVAADGRWQASSEAGRYRITIRPESGRIPIGPLQAWIVELATPDGRPAEVRQLVFDGGMPEHGHGFETKPQVTDVVAPGVFRVDGIRFHMAGRWRIRVDAADGSGADVAFFDVEVKP